MTFDTRKSLLAKVHIAKAQLKLDDDAYRAVLARFGVASAADLDVPGLEKLLHHFAKLGWQAKVARTRKRDKHAAPANLARGGRKGAAKPYDRSALMTKIEALLADKGREQGKHVPWDYAAAILLRMYKVERMEWATAEQLRGVMVALMKGGKRKKRLAPPVAEVEHAAP